MDDGGIDTSFIHQGDGLLGGKMRHLPMGEVTWQTGSPEVDLGVDYLHRALAVRYCGEGSGNARGCHDCRMRQHRCS